VLTRSTTITATGFTVGIYEDAGGAPGALLGAGVYVGTPPLSTWVAVTVSIPIVSGTDYWMAIVNTGGGSMGYALDDSGPPVASWEADDAHTTLDDPFPAGSSSGDYPGPSAIAAYAVDGGGGGGGDTSISTGLEFHLTGIIPFGETVAPYYGRIADPQAGEVVIPLNDSRTASVTVSAYDDICETLAEAIEANDLHQIPYETHLKVYYDGLLVFWGPIKVRSVDMVAGTVRFDAVDMSLRLVKHFIREGDLLLGNGQVDATTGQGYLPISSDGLKRLRDAGNTTSFPPLGIDDGTDDFAPDPNAIAGVMRGDQIWSTWLQIVQTLGPDFELEPRDASDGYYCQLNTYAHQGSDISAAVQLHYGTGRQNLDALSFVEGEEYSNLAHVLDRDAKYRETITNATALTRTGPYITWDATDFDTKHSTEADARTVLDAHGQDIIDAYSRPLVGLSLTLPVDTSDGYHYFIDYKVGDTIGVAGKAGFVTLPEAPYRITRVTLTQDGEGVRPSLEVIADRASSDSITGDEDS
jgi:hypothetical protein